MELHERLLLKPRSKRSVRRGARALLGGLALLTLTWAAPTAEPSGGFTSLARLAGQGAQVSAVVWDLSTDQPLAQLQPAQRLTPASLSKIVIAAAALDTWPPDHTFATELRAAASPVGGVVEGDLVLRSEGDATLDETTLWGLAAQLRSLGVKRVTGRLLVERAPFGELGCDTVDRCNSMRRSARAYNATPSAIGVNYGSWCINVRAPAGAASRAEVVGCATGELPVPLTGSVRIAAGGPALVVERTTGAQGDAIAVSGSIAPGDERSVHRAMSDPAAGAGQILRSILRQAGISVEGGVETTGAADAARLLARVDGLLLQEQVGRMMRWSNNYIADVLTMGVALKRRGSAPASLAAASGELSAYIARNTCCGGAPGAVMESGSGLTTSNRLSALDLVTVLRAGYRDTRAFPAFYGSFVVPGDASFAYLRSGNADWQRRVALKTGSLTEPVSVNGIAGYLRRKDGGFLAFAVIVNGGEKLRQIPHERALAAARADIEAVLAKY